MRESRDVLAAAPHLLGFTPQNSLVLLLVSGAALVATLRVDVPELAARHDLTGDEVSTVIARAQRYVEPVADVDRIFVIAYGAPAPGERMAYAELIEDLSVTLALDSVEVAEAWYVGAGRWRHYVCPKRDCCPVTGRPVAELATAEANVEFTVRGSAPANGLWDGSTHTDWPDRSRVRCIADEFARGQRSRLTIKTLLRRWNGLLETQSTEALDELRRDPEFTGSIVGSLRRLQARNFILALGGDALALEQVPLERGDLGYRPASDESVAIDHEPMVSRTLSFVTGTLHCQPNWPRLDRLWEVAFGLLPATEGEDRSALLVLMAWMEWARGRSSAAAALLASSGGRDIGDQLAEMVHTKVRDGVLANWTHDPGRAWRVGPASEAA
nr:DUF4192 family protein [Zhihengliuella flava]